MPDLIRGTTPILKVVVVGAYLAGFAFAGFGVILVFLGSIGNTEFSFFGQTFKSANVGISAIFLGSASVVMLVRRALHSIDSVVHKESPDARRSGTSELEIVSIVRTKDFGNRRYIA